MLREEWITLRVILLESPVSGGVSIQMGCLPLTCPFAIFFQILY